MRKWGGRGFIFNPRWF